MKKLIIYCISAFALILILSFALLVIGKFRVSRTQDEVLSIYNALDLGISPEQASSICQNDEYKKLSFEKMNSTN